MADYKIIGVQVNSEQDALLQKYIKAVQIIQQGSNVDMYDGWDGTLEEKYNYNNVWHLVKREGNLDHWILTYEGKLALEMQESLDTDYSILFFDFNRDVEVEEKFFRKAGV